MSKRSTQNCRSRRLASRVIGFVVVLALFSLQQAWAAALCLCDHGNQPVAEVDHCSHHKAAPAEHPDSSTHAGMNHNSMHHQSGGAMHDHSGMREETAGDRRETIQSGKGPTVAEGRRDSAPPLTLSCCQPQPKTDLPAVSFSAQQEPLEFEGSTLQLDSIPQLAPTSLNIFKPPRSRPVYLTVSSLLI